MAKGADDDRWLVDLLEVQPDDRVLEVGFGPGVAIEAVVRRLFEAINRDDGRIDELVAPDCEIVGPAGSGQGPAIYRNVFAMQRAAFPDVEVTIDELLAAEGYRVMVRTRTSGTHRGVFMGLAPTSKRVTWAGGQRVGSLATSALASAQRTRSSGGCGLDRDHVAQPWWDFAGADLGEPGLSRLRLEVGDHPRHPIETVHARKQLPAETAAGLLSLGHE